MAFKIRVLDEHTINKIAAGEVIENPASVVKELVENAVDAGSTSIRVEIKGGGRQLIRVSDNGSGMGRDDALLCLERHATSKIRDIQDLHSIETMGFRGEAVPSIASISKLILLTRSADEKEGTLIIVDGGHIQSCSPASCAFGTTFEIKSLFFNVPVRKKFQRSPTYDTAEVQKVLTLQALANPTIEFELISNEKNILSTLPEKNESTDPMGKRISDVLGVEYFSNLCVLEKDFDAYKLKGYIGKPNYSRHNRTGQYLFINKRAVTCSSISYALKSAYGTTLETNRHPVFVLYLMMDGHLVDINVHPQKQQVRLREEYKLKELITKAVEEALQKSGTPFFESYPSQEFGAFAFKPRFEEPLVFSRPPEYTKAPFTSSSEMFFKSPQPSFSEMRTEELPFCEPSSIPKVVTTIRGYTLLLSPDEKLILLDQRAAHARILYEQFSSSSHHCGPTQELLIPYTLNLTPSEKALLKNHLSPIKSLGFQVIESEADQFTIHCIPKLFEETNLQDLIIDIIQVVGEEGADNIIEKKMRQKLWQKLAQAAIPKNHKITKYEAERLYNELIKCQISHLCPQGKPIIIELSQEEIAKLYRT